MEHDVAVMRSAACLCLGAFAFCSSSLTASELSFGANLDGNSRYVWRGMALIAGPVLQPSAWLSFVGLTFTPWADFAFREVSYLRPHAALSVLLDRELRAAVPSPLFATGGLAIGGDL